MPSIYPTTMTEMFGGPPDFRDLDIIAGHGHP
jgi:hypothetical protein